MKIFELKYDTEFIWSDTSEFIWVSTLKDIKIPSVKDSDWKHSDFVIGPGEEHDRLMIFGVVIEKLVLKRLSEKLRDAYLLVNREGFCFMNTDALTGPLLRAQYYRLNDLFDWSDFNVKPVIRTAWNRNSLESDKLIVGLPNAKTGSKGVESSEEKTRERITGQGSTDSDSDDCGCVKDEDEVIDDVNEVVDKWQREIPSNRFTISTYSRQPIFAKVQESNPLPEFTPLNEAVQGNFPRNVAVHTSDGVFKTELWFAIRAKMGKDKCMIAYYCGSHTEIRAGNGEYNYFLPYNKGQILTSNTEFFLANMRGSGVTCLAFKYT